MNLSKILNSISGYKTYGVILAMLVVGLMQQEGWIMVDTAENLHQYLLYAGGATMVAKLNRMAGKPEA